jgi:rhodanese-related sulfurtransferase
MPLVYFFWRGQTMKPSMRLVFGVGALALLVGLILGVAIGRSRAPFSLSSSLALEDSQSSLSAQSGSTPSISVAELRGLIESGGPVSLIDVREPDEYASVHIPGSKSIPLGAIWARQSEIPRDRAVVVYCSSDLRGEIAAHELIKLGYSNVRYLDGGISAWQNAGLAVVR